MQSENAATIINLLQASYPQEAYKLRDDKVKKIFSGTQYGLLLYDVFGKVPDELMLKAIHLAIKSYQKLPSIGDIAKCIDQCRPTPQLPQLPPKRSHKVLPWIHEAFVKACDQKYQIPISDNLRTFAKQYFSDITDDMIRKNYPELSSCMHSGMQVDGYKTVMRMDKETGFIDVRICIDKYMSHRTNGVPDSFNKVFGEGA